MTDTFDWFKPSPTWQPNGRDLLSPATRDTFRRPQLLEFGDDTFMESFFALAAAASGDTFANQEARNDPLDADKRLKLFQPAHGRFYLICASLCCLRPGFPDRMVRTGNGESTFFVLRKRLDGQEYAWVTEGDGPRGWQPVTEPSGALLQGEERLPLFPVPAGNGRRLLFGYVPVASRETYAVKPDEFLVSPLPPDARIMELEGRFLEQLPVVTNVADDEIALQLSIYLLLDLWEYLHAYLPGVAVAIRGDETDALEGAQADLAATLEDIPLGGSVTLVSALRDVATQRDTLNDLADDPLPSPFAGNDDYSLKAHPLTETEITAITTAVGAALAEADEAAGEEAPAVDVPKLRADTGESYVLHCVYEQCDEGKLRQWASRPSVEFELAAFFDPDAPARPLRIALPTDVSIGGLRKLKKGVAFLMSDSLREKLGDVGSTNLNTLVSSQEMAALGLGYICSFSLPIITICAFILLLVMVIVLHLVFWWIPFFKICLPIPKPSSS